MVDKQLCRTIGANEALLYLDVVLSRGDCILTKTDQYYVGRLADGTIVSSSTLTELMRNLRAKI